MLSLNFWGEKKNGAFKGVCYACGGAVAGGVG
jgi:hypothetical protein